MELNPKDVHALVREKYAGDANAPGFTHDKERLAAGEPLAYVIGTIPFLGLTIHLDSHPLIPRPETEWWTEELINHVRTESTRVLDLCAGSGAIGLSILKSVSGARVSLGELMPQHAATIRKNIEANGLDASRADIRTGDLFAPFVGERFDIIATNPPYIPTDRQLPESVTDFEPTEALYAGMDGLSVIKRILGDAPQHLTKGGELWMECDIANIESAKAFALDHGATRADIRTDPYERPRLLVAYY